MADTSKIDQFFDAFDRVIDAADRGINGTRRVDDRQEERRAPKKVRSAPSSSTAVATRRARFRIEEVTDASTGDVLYIVTDGATARCEFASKATAQQILEKLESST